VPRRALPRGLLANNDRLSIEKTNGGELPNGPPRPQRDRIGNDLTRCHLQVRSAGGSSATRKLLLSPPSVIPASRLVMTNRTLPGCRRFCSCESTRLQQSSTDFNKQGATGSTAITWNQQNSTDFNKLWNLVRDQGVGGSNPLSPTNIFSSLAAPSGFSSTSL
jgi:hypothetical protein